MLSQFEVATTFLPEGIATWNAVQQMDNALRVRWAILSVGVLTYVSARTVVDYCKRFM